MNSQNPTYRDHRFRFKIISYTVWLSYRFCLSFRDNEELLADRGVTVSYKSVRQWCLKFGSSFAKKLRQCQGRLGDTWHLDGYCQVEGARADSATIYCSRNSS